MKILFLSATVMVFALAAQAGETKASNEKSACCQAKTTVAAKTCTTSKDAKACCGGTACKETPTKQALLSPKAAAEVTKKL